MIRVIRYNKNTGEGLISALKEDLAPFFPSEIMDSISDGEKVWAFGCYVFYDPLVPSGDGNYEYGPICIDDPIMHFLNSESPKPQPVGYYPKYSDIYDMFCVELARKTEEEEKKNV